MHWSNNKMSKRLQLNENSVMTSDYIKIGILKSYLIYT